MRPGAEAGRSKKDRGSSPSVSQIRLVGTGDSHSLPGWQGREARDKRRVCRHESRKLKQARRSRAGTVDLLRGGIRACYSPKIYRHYTMETGICQEQREKTEA